MNLFKGSGVALITPMNAVGIDWLSLEKLVDWHLTSGTQALIITGTTGEAATLTDEEKCLIYEKVVKQVGGRLQVIAGTGSNATSTTQALSIKAEKIGVDALLLVTPYYNKPTQKGLYEHYVQVASSVKIPVILYNVPSRTSVDLEAETVISLSKISNIKGLKEAKGDLNRIAFLSENISEDFKLYSGNDYDMASFIEKGGHGVISVLANLLPQVTQMICENALEEKWDDAFAAQAHYLPLMEALFCETNPVPVKTALSWMGYCEPRMRLPLSSLDPVHAKRLKALLETYGLIERGGQCVSSF